MKPRDELASAGVGAVALAALAIAGCSRDGGANLSAQLAELHSQVAALQHQAQRADDYIAIANLQAVYGYYVDKSRWDDAADLFAKDATLEIAGRGLFRGQDHIRTYLHQLGDMQYGRLFNHMQLQPVIDIAADGLSAKARWRSLMQVGHLGKEARWGEATYENEYVKDGGVWKISKLHSYITFYVEFDKGWNKGGVALPGHLEGLQPDEESTVKYGAFPEVFLPPYHYANPVTGKAP
ncbi:MAG TPA: nuclear transport factor 2 family protein [Steroidobacteraceae bacterium]|nr:nuclear transport factor 2 family protein [Steroidobacteraceae bacterium]